VTLSDDDGDDDDDDDDKNNKYFLFTRRLNSIAVDYKQGRYQKITPMNTVKIKARKRGKERKHSI